VSNVAGLIRSTCLDLPNVTERLSHGAPTYFIRAKKSFASVMMDGHHDLEFAHLVCAAVLGVQPSLVAGRPDVFFIPAYVGTRGWIGVRLDRDLVDDELVELCEDGYRTVAPITLLRQLEVKRSQ
jgi:hypothetical protein